MNSTGIEFATSMDKKPSVLMLCGNI